MCACKSGKPSNPYYDAPTTKPALLFFYYPISFLCGNSLSFTKSLFKNGIYYYKLRQNLPLHWISVLIHKIRFADVDKLFL